MDFEVADFFDYSTTKRYDVILAMDVIEHLPEDLGRKLVATATCFLKRGDTILAQESANPIAWLRKLHEIQFESDAFRHYVRSG